MATNQTTNYQLNQWEPTDAVQRVEFNQDNAKVDAALDLLAERGFDPTYGARPLRRCICTQLEDPAAEALLSGRTGPGDRLIADAKDGKLVLETR